MKVYDAANIRNVALVGHSASGKTQLTSAALFDAGAVNRFGKVDEGTTITDYDDEEIARKHTLSAGLAYAEWNKTKINFIDTPGIANFLADTRAALAFRCKRRSHGRPPRRPDCPAWWSSIASTASARAWSARSSRFTPR